MESDFFELLYDNFKIILIFSGIINIVILIVFLILVQDVNAIKHQLRSIDKKLGDNKTPEK